MVEKKRSGRATRLAKSLAVLVVLLVVLALALVLVWSRAKTRERVVGAVLEGVLGARVDISGVSLSRQTRIDTLTLRDMPTQPDDAPLISLKGIQLDCDPWPAQNRYFPRLAIESLSLTFDGRDPVNPNYDFVSRLLQAPSSGRDVTPFLPAHVSLDAMSLAARMYTWSASLHGVCVQGDIEGMDSLDFSVHGDEARAEWSVPGVRTGLESIEGSLGFDFSRKGDRLVGRGIADFPGLAALDASLEVEKGEDGMKAGLALNELVLHEDLWGVMAESVTSVPLRFDEIRATDSRVAVSFSSGIVDVTDASISADVHGLVVGPETKPYYRGDISVAGGGRAGAESDLSFSITLNEGQVLQTTLRGGPVEGAADLALSDWTRGQIAASMPEAQRHYLDRIPKMESLSASIRAEWTSPDYAMTGTLTPAFAGLGPVPWKVAAHGSLKQPPMCRGDIATDWRQGVVAVQWQVDSPDKFDVRASLDDVSPRDYLEGWLGLNAFSQLDCRVDGVVALNSTPSGPVEARLNIAADGLVHEKVTIPAGVPISVEADVLLGEAGPQGEHTVVAVGDSARAALSDWSLTLAPVLLEGHIEGEADLSAVGAWFGFPELQGEIAYAAELAAGDTSLTLASLDATTETVGYGDWTTPYRMPVTVKTTLRLAYEGTKMDAEDIELALGSDTQIKVTGASFLPAAPDASFVAAIADVLVETGLAPLVSKDYLQEADGHATLKGTGISYGEQGFKGEIEYTVNAGTMLLPKAVAALYGLTAQGVLEYDGELRGAGSLAATSAIVGGAALRDLRAAIVGQGKTLRVVEGKCDLFGGAVKADVAMDPFEPGMPVRLTASVDNADLAVFTDEYKPSTVRLTGRIRGEASLVFTAEGLQDLKADFRTVEGLTLNRQTVEQILLSQYMDSAAGGKTLSKMVQDTIGKDPDRFFDSARLRLGFENGEILGTATLDSRLLSLTVDIKADPESLTTAMMLRQAERVQFETLDNKPNDEVQ